MGAVTKSSGPAAALDLTDGQVRSRARVRDLAEVFTHEREVTAILDQLPKAVFADLDSKFLEPACGSGNFLVEILERKLALIDVSSGDLEHQALRAVASIYGVDICAGNIAEARDRLLTVLREYLTANAPNHQLSRDSSAAADLIVGTNIVLGDTLDAPGQIELCDWQPATGGRFRRVWSCALIPPQDRDLFWSERIQDPAPVHYSTLIANEAKPRRAGDAR